MNVSKEAKQLIRWIYALSPYFWLDRHFRLREQAHAPESEAWQHLRDLRLTLSEWYIVGWFAVALLFTIITLRVELYVWLVPLLLLRVGGILNKELGVILFGICKITEGSRVSASGRVIVIALVNYVTAMLLFAAVYQSVGAFRTVPDYLAQGWDWTGLIQAVNIHTTLAGPFTPANGITWFVMSVQSTFCFMFGTIVLSLFVSLLNIKPLKAE